MEFRELLGYFFLILAIAGIGASLWAVWYFSHPRVYHRQLRRERQARREAQAQEQKKRSDL